MTAAIDGVHCTWVTAWRPTWATNPASTSSSAAIADSRSPSGSSTDADAGVGGPAQLVEVLEGGEHDVLVDAEVDEAGDLVDAELAQVVDLGQARLGRAEQPGRADVALEGVVHDHGDLVGVELVEVGHRRRRRPARRLAGLGEARRLPLHLVDEVGRRLEVVEERLAHERA